MNSIDSAPLSPEAEAWAERQQTISNIRKQLDGLFVYAATASQPENLPRQLGQQDGNQELRVRDGVLELIAVRQNPLETTRLTGKPDFLGKVYILDYADATSERIIGYQALEITHEGLDREPNVVELINTMDKSGEETRFVRGGDADLASVERLEIELFHFQDTAGAHHSLFLYDGEKVQVLAYEQRLKKEADGALS